MLNRFHFINKNSEGLFEKYKGLILLNKSTPFSFHKFNFKIIGKVFRWYFNSKKMRLSLNHGHINSFLFRDIRIFKISRLKYDSDIIFLDPTNTRRLLYFIEKPRKINIFTKRGLFVNKSYSKKLGKISAYI